MSNAAIMAPVFAMLGLTFFVTAKMGAARAGEIAAGKTKIRDIALGDNAWSDVVKKVSNNYGNLLQLPLLMYAAVAFFVVLGKVDLVAVILAWGFTVARFVHTFIHITNNRVSNRFKVFGLSILFLIAMWVWLALRLYLIG